MTDARNIASCGAMHALRERDARKNAVTQLLAGLILLAAGYFMARSGYGETVGAAHPLCALMVLLGGLALCAQAMLVVFKAMLAQYGHFAMSAEEAALSLYEFRVAAAMVLAGARLLVPWRPAQIVCDLALAAILLYCALTRLRAVRLRAWRQALGGALLALDALAALALIYGAFAGFSWSLNMGIAAGGYALDSLFCALTGANAL